MCLSIRIVTVAHWSDSRETLLGKPLGRLSLSIAIGTVVHGRIRAKFSGQPASRPAGQPAGQPAVGQPNPKGFPENTLGFHVNPFGFT